MTFGNRIATCLALGFLLALGLDTQAAAQLPGWSLTELMRGLAAIKSAKTDFTENQFIGIATKPLHSSGNLVYAAPDRLEKNTLLPREQSIVIDGEKLIMRQGKGRARTVKLGDHPEVGAFIESIRSTLSGDTATLSRYYRLALKGDAAHWELTLEPINEKVNKLVKTVHISGTQYTLLSVEIAHADGDRSVMTMVKSSQ